MAGNITDIPVVLSGSDREGIAAWVQVRRGGNEVGTIRSADCSPMALEHGRVMDAFRPITSPPFDLTVTKRAINVDGRWIPGLDVEMWGTDAWPDEEGSVATFVVPLENGRQVRVCLSAHPHPNGKVWTRLIDCFVVPEPKGTADIEAHLDLRDEPQCPRGFAAVMLIDEDTWVGLDSTWDEFYLEHWEGVTECSELSAWLNRFARLDPSRFCRMSKMTPPHAA